MIANLTITCWCEAIKPGCTFVARTYDRATGQFYSGSGATASEALAWCLDDYVRRRDLGLPHRIAMRSDERPGEGLGAVRDDNAEITTVTKRTPAASREPALFAPSSEFVDATNSSGCFGGPIPTKPEPAVFPRGAR